VLRCWYVDTRGLRLQSLNRVFYMVVNGGLRQPSAATAAIRKTIDTIRLDSLQIEVLASINHNSCNLQTERPLSVGCQVLRF
jgi:3-deoxy-D-arabino-heptulosonate 7-phosphate (DAHP) synthase